jgi:hypothetical protein
MGRSVRLSKKHGVNPTIPICFWCGKERNEIALMGRIGREDKKAPMYSVIDYEPCENCRKAFDAGILVVGVKEKTDDRRPAIGKNKRGRKLFPTGAFCVVTKDWVTKTFCADFAKEVINEGKFLCDHYELVQMLESVDAAKNN